MTRSFVSSVCWLPGWPSQALLAFLPGGQVAIADGVIPPFGDICLPRPGTSLLPCQRYIAREPSGLRGPPGTPRPLCNALSCRLFKFHKMTVCDTRDGPAPSVPPGVISDRQHL